VSSTELRSIGSILTANPFVGYVPNTQKMRKTTSSAMVAF